MLGVTSAVICDCWSCSGVQWHSVGAVCRHDECMSADLVWPPAGVMQCVCVLHAAQPLHVSLASSDRKSIRRGRRQHGEESAPQRQTPTNRSAVQCRAEQPGGWSTCISTADRWIGQAARLTLTIRCKCPAL